MQTKRKLTLGGAVEAVAIALALTLCVSWRSGEPIWDVPPGMLALGLLTGTAYMTGRVAYGLSSRRGLTRATSIAALVSAPLLLALLLLDLPVSRVALLGELILLAMFLASAAAPAQPSVRLSLSLVLLAAAAYPTVTGVTEFQAGTIELSSDAVEYGFTSYHDVSIASFPVLAGQVQSGGAITLLPDGRVLLVAGNGEAAVLRIGDGLEVSRVELGISMDVAAYREQAQNPNKLNDYRVTDALYSEGHLLVAYTHWHREEDCFTLRLIDAELDGTAAGPWTTRFDSQPCLEELSNQGGGRIATLGSSDILLTVGTFGRSWGAEADYGKILRFDRNTWQSRVFTRGHRNPQGLLVSNGRIWSAEHGPQGGDELNLIEADSDYGWPHVSYGTDYGRKTLSEGATPGDHSGFVPPVYSWVPSIGVSDLIEVSGEAFPLWKGDLLVGSLSGRGNGESLFRVKLLQGRVVSMERIPTGRRVRDVMEIDGGILLWDGGGAVQLVRPADHVFSSCAGCHTLRPDLHGIGPYLAGIVGTPVARHGNYGYSEAMRRYGGSWTPARLDRFLRDPQSEVPGTTMEFEGISDPAERAEIIEFLHEVLDGAAD